jgi:hypothetical protein
LAGAPKADFVLGDTIICEARGEEDSEQLKAADDDAEYEPRLP